MNEFLDKYNRFPTAQRWLLFILLLLVIVGGFYFFMILPTTRDIQSTNNDIVATNNEINELAAKKQKRQDLLKDIEALQMDLVRVQNQLPDTNQIPNLLQQIHDQARTAGLQIKRFERTTDVPRDHYVEIPVKMNLEGTYDQLANFLYYVGRLTRIVNVRDLSMKATSSDLNSKNPNDLGQLQVTALATTFRYKNDGDTANKKGGKK